MNVQGAPRNDTAICRQTSLPCASSEESDADLWLDMLGVGVGGSRQDSNGQVCATVCGFAELKTPLLSIEGLPVLWFLFGKQMFLALFK